MSAKTKQQKKIQSTVSLKGGLSLLIALPLFAACSAKTPDQKAVDQAIQKMVSGELVASIENAKKMQEADPEGSAGKTQSADPAAQAAVDPCPGLGAGPSVMASDEVFKKALVGLGGCIREQFESLHAADAAIEFFKMFKMESAERPLSAMTDGEIATYIEENAVDRAELILTTSSKSRRLRGGYSDAELDELVALVKRKKAALSRAESATYRAMDARPEIVKHFAKSVNRYALLQALHDTAQDTDGALTASAINPILANSRMKFVPEGSNFPFTLLHPYAVMAAIPDEGAEDQPLDRGEENPYKGVMTAIANLGGGDELVGQTRAAYAKIRDLDNPAMPEHEPAAADAVKVAVMDSGIDFMTHPDLGLFLGSGKTGQMASYDFADGDANPWAPAIDSEGFFHGSGTSATLLTIMAHYAPETLRARKLDLAMWKVFSVRDLLQGPASGLGSYNSHMGPHEAIVNTIEGAGVKPKIVSVSLGFTFQKFAEKAGYQGILKKAPWLWVMAAGNSGVELSTERHKTCFDDVPEAERLDGRILCVGALSPGIVNDKIAAYSNFGKRVDVYALESYIGLCPNGTSCSTPAVAGAAAVIAAKYPKLTPEQIKEAIVGAAEERTLEVDFGEDEKAAMAAQLTGTDKRTIKVFNPPAMMSKALEIAGKLASGKTASKSAPKAAATASGVKKTEKPAPKRG